MNAPQDTGGEAICIYLNVYICVYVCAYVYISMLSLAVHKSYTVVDVMYLSLPSICITSVITLSDMCSVIVEVKSLQALCRHGKMHAKTLACTVAQYYTDHYFQI